MNRNSAYILIGAVLCLSGLGLVMLLSVSAFAPDNRGDAMHFISRQSVFCGIGLAVCVVAALVDYHVWIRHAWWMVLGSLALLGLCFVPGVGLEVKGASRWIDLGPVNLQASEVVKVCVVSFLAYWLGKNHRHVREFKRGVLVPLGVVGLLSSVIVFQPDLGTVAMLVAVTTLMLFVAGVRMVYLLPIPLVGISGIIGIAFTMPERVERLFAFANPEAHLNGGAWQVYQGLIALGSGGFWGLGLGNSIQKMRYLPEAHTDFIFSVVGEELGLVATLAVVFCFLLLVVAGGSIACHAPEPTGVLLGLGLTSLIGLQAGFNIAVVTAMVPTKGIGLPFISYGGSNLVMCLLCVGVLINIHKQALYEEREAPRHLANSIAFA